MSDTNEHLGILLFVGSFVLILPLLIAASLHFAG